MFFFSVVVWSFFCCCYRVFHPSSSIYTLLLTVLYASDAPAFHQNLHKTFHNSADLCSLLSPAIVPALLLRLPSLACLNCKTALLSCSCPYACIESSSGDPASPSVLPFVSIPAWSCVYDPILSPVSRDTSLCRINDSFATCGRLSKNVFSGWTHNWPHLSRRDGKW